MLFARLHDQAWRPTSEKIPPLISAWPRQGAKACSIGKTEIGNRETPHRYVFTLQRATFVALAARRQFRPLRHARADVQTHVQLEPRFRSLRPQPDLAKF